MGSERDPDSSLSCNPFIESLHRALKIRNASLCMIEGNAIEVVITGGISLITTASSTLPLVVGGLSLLVTASSPLPTGLIDSTFSVTFKARAASVTTLIKWSGGKRGRGSEKDVKKVFREME